MMAAQASDKAFEIVAQPAAMAGDLVSHQEGDKLHFDVIYDQPVMCHCGKCATEGITEVKDGEIVIILHVPRDIQETKGVPGQFMAVRVGGWNSPAFRYKYEDGTDSDVVITYEEMICCQEQQEEEIVVSVYRLCGDD